MTIESDVLYRRLRRQRRLNTALFVLGVVGVLCAALLVLG